MSAAFRDREVQKYYLAISIHVPREATRTLVHHLYKPAGRNIVKSSPTPFPGTQRSELSYQVIATRSGEALLLVKPITGRQHQIRVQLSAIHCGLKGDIKYAATDPLPEARIGLYSYALSFIHPVSQERIEIRAPRPDFPEWNFGCNPDEILLSE